MSKTVIVFEGRNEFEAELARDTLRTAMIPVIHVPSISTGILGFPQPVKVAVPEDYAEAAVEALSDAGLSGAITEPSRGLEEVREAVSRGIPVPERSPLPPSSSLGRVLIGLLVGLIAIIVYAVLRGSGSQ